MSHNRFGPNTEVTETKVDFLFCVQVGVAVFVYLFFAIYSESVKFVLWNKLFTGEHVCEKRIAVCSV